MDFRKNPSRLRKVQEFPYPGGRPVIKYLRDSSFIEFRRYSEVEIANAGRIAKILCVK